MTDDERIARFLAGYEKLVRETGVILTSLPDGTMFATIERDFAQVTAAECIDYHLKSVREDSVGC